MLEKRRKRKGLILINIIYVILYYFLPLIHCFEHTTIRSCRARLVAHGCLESGHTWNPLFTRNGVTTGSGVKTTPEFDPLEVNAFNDLLIAYIDRHQSDNNNGQKEEEEQQ